MAGADLPSLESQKQLILDRGRILNRQTKIHIAQLVTMAYDADRTADGKIVVHENAVTGTLSINLDNIDSPELVNQLYRTVVAMVEAMNRPAD